jgi:predicted enzyme related to lactoylglutathione lyase
MANSPKLFRVILQVADLTKAVEFYSKLLAIEGRTLRGSRAYFDCGPVILAILDPTPGGITPRPSVEYIYFAVADLEKVYARASDFGAFPETRSTTRTRAKSSCAPGVNDRSMPKTRGAMVSAS